MVKSALMDSWNLFTNNILGISLIVLPIIIPIEILTSIYTYNLPEAETVTAEEFYPLSISLLFYPIYSVAVVVYISSVVNNNTYTLGQLYKSGLRFYISFAIMSILIGLIFFGGLLLLILPGIYFLIRYTLSEFYLVLEEAKPLDAMRKSWEISNNYIITLFLGYIVIALCLTSPALALNYFLEEGTDIYHLVNTGENIVFSVLNTFYTIYAYRIYEHSKENITSSSSGTTKTQVAP